jgi:hypothetical protein
VPVPAVCAARLSPRAPGFLFRFPLGERRSLTLTRTPRLFQCRLEFFYALGLCVDQLVFLGDCVLEASDDFLKLCNAFPEAHTTLIPNGGPSVVDPRALRAISLDKRGLPRSSADPLAAGKCANQVQFL